MHQQKVEAPKLSALGGLLAVAGIVAALLVDGLCSRLIGRFAGETIGLVLFWALGAAIALWVMRRFILSYSYVMGPNVLRVSFAYWRYERVMIDIYWNNVRYVGELNDARGRFPSARVNKATLKRCNLEELAVVCRDNGKDAIYVLQPDETIRAKLVEVGRSKRKK
ncbi:MAG: hypothetical protein IJ234_02845 [Clostridia bacterium]|nr:hypothetical protein [Clostridia bacterium]